MKYDDNKDVTVDEVSILPPRKTKHSKKNNKKNKRDKDSSKTEKRRINLQLLLIRTFLLLFLLMIIGVALYPIWVDKL